MIYSFNSQESFHQFLVYSLIPQGQRLSPKDWIKSRLYALILPSLFRLFLFPDYPHSFLKHNTEVPHAQPLMDSNSGQVEHISRPCTPAHKPQMSCNSECYFSLIVSGWAKSTKSGKRKTPHADLIREKYTIYSSESLISLRINLTIFPQRPSSIYGLSRQNRNLETLHSYHPPAVY